MGPLKRKGAMTLAELQQKAERDGAAVARVGVVVSGLQERKSGRGTRFFRMNISDPTGQVSGMALFPEDFDAIRKVFEKTTQVVMTLEARFNEGQFDPVARGAAPLDGIVADAGSAGLRVFVEAPEAAPTVRTILDRAKGEAGVKGRGPIELCLLAPDLPGEVGILLGEDFPVSPQIKAALKAVGGVLTVEEL
jgi:DNA polymerase-3 subunit alpha